MKKSIGIYGGSFDPIHHGHLNVAITMIEAHRLDQIWFCPTSANPLKPAKTHTDPHHRLAMLRLGVEGELCFNVIEEEIFLSGPAYTVDTLLRLTSRPDAELYTFSLIIGEDSARDFHRWRSPERIIQLARLLVAQRAGCGDQSEPFQGSSEVVDAIHRGMTPVRLMDISSTEVRERISEGKYCGHLAPIKVLDYIAEHQLYL